jgi:hypothetical protein
MREKTIPTCWICGYPVPPVDYKSDTRGRAIHENCYAAALAPYNQFSDEDVKSA